MPFYGFLILDESKRQAYIYTPLVYDGEAGARTTVQKEFVAENFKIQEPPAIGTIEEIRSQLVKKIPTDYKLAN